MESPIALKVTRLSRDIYWLLESPFFVIAEKSSVCLERGHSHKPLCVDRPLEISVEVFVVVVYMNTNVRSRRVEEEILNSVRSITSVRYSKT